MGGREGGLEGGWEEWARDGGWRRGWVFLVAAGDLSSQSLSQVQPQRKTEGEFWDSGVPVARGGEL